uniref:Uncharacterized protein n=1 Tax=Timema cristinae TaxID=61476 RepID=A0A7R9CD57_TIMCR|nr:unnamed protein product [Timema cristinae]
MGERGRGLKKGIDRIPISPSLFPKIENHGTASRIAPEVATLRLSVVPRAAGKVDYVSCCSSVTIAVVVLRTHKANPGWRVVILPNHVPTQNDIQRQQEEFQHQELYQHVQETGKTVNCVEIVLVLGRDKGTITG